MSRAVRVARRLALHEARSLAGIALWLARRRAGVGPGDTAAPYAGAQATTLLALGFVCVVETVGLALIIPWPPLHLTMLVLDLYTVVLVFGLHASSVARPHVVGPDGSLRVRYAALLDLRVPAGQIASARVVRRFPDGGLLTVDDGTLTVAVGGQTTLTVQLREPVTFLRPLGTSAVVRTLHLHADAPGEFVAALDRARQTGTATEPTSDADPEAAGGRTPAEG
ncbi:hypothetical protein [Streptomyces sp. PU-14G]|uniref:hypothetical protein n=1 Tax=Streptomyces sp. PU-14G TaxID=2800808 RepID=UPI0034DFF2B1